jgi:hypothetical protein
MSECIFCIIPDIIGKSIPAYCIGIPVPKNQHYLRYYNMNISSIKTQNELVSATTFTPGSRRTLNLEEANRLIAHQEAWTSILSSKEPYGVVFENSDDLESEYIKNRLENAKIPKGWDLIKISANQYLITKSAAKILIFATRQFHSPLKQLIDSVKMMKVYDLP